MMSPPEAKPLDHFNDSTVPVHTANGIHSSRRNLNDVGVQKQDISIKIPPSPPDSPWRKLHHHHSVPEHESNGTAKVKTFQNDPVLYPNESTGRVNGSLFDDTRDEDERARVIEQHMRCHYLVPKSKGTQAKRFEMPTKEEYLLMVNCVSRIGQMYNRNPGAYLKRAREEDEEKHHLAKRSRTSLVQVGPVSKPGRAPQLPLQRAPFTSTRPMRPAGSPARAAPHQTPIARVRQDVSSVRRSSPAKRQEPPNFNFDEVPDYSPALSTLPDNPKSLTVDWQGNALDLSADPHRHLLHVAEVYLASRLRLTCASYLCVKRRIFVGRVNNFVRGKKFTKTDAQSCGHIDVNKSSKIWTAYDKVGWFDRKHFAAAVEGVASSSRCYDPASQCFVDTAKFLF